MSGDMQIKERGRIPGLKLCGQCGEPLPGDLKCLSCGAQNETPQEEALAPDPDSLARWRRLRPTAKQMLRMGSNKDAFHYALIGTHLELWGNGFMLLRGKPPDVPLHDRSDDLSFRLGIKRHLENPGVCSVEPLLYVKANGYGPQGRDLLIMALRSPVDSDVLEHLTVNARMALFVEREVQSRFPDDWILGWRGDLSAESQDKSLPPLCARIHPKPLTYCVRRPDSDAIVAGVLMPRTTGAGHTARVSASDGSMVLRYDRERRVYYEDPA